MSTITPIDSVVTIHQPHPDAELERSSGQDLNAFIQRYTHVANQQAVVKPIEKPDSENSPIQDGTGEVGTLIGLSTFESVALKVREVSAPPVFEARINALGKVLPSDVLERCADRQNDSHATHNIWRIRTANEVANKMGFVKPTKVIEDPSQRDSSQAEYYSVFDQITGLYDVAIVDAAGLVADTETLKMRSAGVLALALGLDCYYTNKQYGITNTHYALKYPLEAILWGEGNDLDLLAAEQLAELITDNGEDPDGYSLEGVVRRNQEAVLATMIRHTAMRNVGAVLSVLTNRLDILERYFTELGGGADDPRINEIVKYVSACKVLADDDMDIDVVFGGLNVTFHRGSDGQFEVKDFSYLKPGIKRPREVYLESVVDKTVDLTQVAVAAVATNTPNDLIAKPNLALQRTQIAMFQRAGRLEANIAIHGVHGAVLDQEYRDEAERRYRNRSF